MYVLSYKLKYICLVLLELILITLYSIFDLRKCCFLVYLTIFSINKYLSYVNEFKLKLLQAYENFLFSEKRLNFKKLQALKLKKKKIIFPCTALSQN